MDGECIRQWLKSVLPKLKDQGVIIMNNTQHDFLKQNNFPTINSRKADIIEWLEEKGEVVDTSMIIPELLEIVNRLMPKYDKYIFDEMVKEHNKYVLRLPPHHRELNPINLMLPSMINYVKMNRKARTVDQLLIEWEQKTTPEMWKTYIKNTIEEENKLWNMDYVVDELMSEL